MTDVNMTSVATPVDAPLAEAVPESLAPESVPPTDGQQAAPAAPEPSVPPQKSAYDDQFARQFAIMAKKERELVAKEQHLKSVQAKLQEYENLSNLARENPLEFIQKHGITYKDLTERVVNDGIETIDQRLARENAKLQERIANLEGTLGNITKEREEASYKSTYQGFIDEIKNFANNTPEEYDLVQRKGAYPLVAEVMQEHYKTTQEVLPYATALKLVEDHLEAEAKAFFESPKLKKKYVPEAVKEAVSAPPAPTGAAQGNQAASVAPKTLSNTHNAQQTVRNPSELLSKEESLARAAALLRWT